MQRIQLGASPSTALLTMPRARFCRGRARSADVAKWDRSGLRARLPVVAKSGDRSGLHDPAGPAGSWGTGAEKGRKEKAAQEEAFVMQERVAAAQESRSDQHASSMVRPRRCSAARSSWKSSMSSM